jgi:hypothetical protein
MISISPSTSLRGFLCLASQFGMHEDLTIFEAAETGIKGLAREPSPAKAAPEEALGRLARVGAAVRDLIKSGALRWHCAGRPGKHLSGMAVPRALRNPEKRRAAYCQ